MYQAARNSYLNDSNWIKYFYDAAYPPPSRYPSYNVGLAVPPFSTSKEFIIGATDSWGLTTPVVRTWDRSVAVDQLIKMHPMLNTSPPVH